MSVFVELCEAEIDYVQLVPSFLGTTHQEVVWLYVSVQDLFFVADLDPLNHHLPNQKHRFKVELPLAFLKKVFERKA